MLFRLNKCFIAINVNNDKSGKYYCPDYSRRLTSKLEIYQDIDSFKEYLTKFIMIFFVTKCWTHKMQISDMYPLTAPHLNSMLYNTKNKNFFSS